MLHNKHTTKLVNFLCLNRRPHIQVHLCNPRTQEMKYLHSHSGKGLGNFHPSHCHPWECQAGCSCSYYWESSVKKSTKYRFSAEGLGSFPASPGEPRVCSTQNLVHSGALCSARMKNQPQQGSA